MNDPYRCDCFDQYSVSGCVDLSFHAEEQDTTCRGWQRLLELVEEAASAGREAFDPREHMADDEWVQLVTLPQSIGKLKSVKRLMLAHSTIPERQNRHVVCPAQGCDPERMKSVTV